MDSGLTLRGGGTAYKTLWRTDALVSKNSFEKKLEGGASPQTGFLLHMSRRMSVHGTTMFGEVYAGEERISSWLVGKLMCEGIGLPITGAQGRNVFLPC